MFTISETSSEKMDEPKERVQRSTKPPFYEVTNPMVNLGISLSNEVMSSMFPPSRHSFYSSYPRKQELGFFCLSGLSQDCQTRQHSLSKWGNLEESEEKIV